MGRVCHWPSLVRDVLLFHQSGPGAARSAQELERDEGLQERRVPPAEGLGREGGAPAPASARRSSHGAIEGAGGLHWGPAGGPIQGRHLPVLNSFWSSFSTLECVVPIPDACLGAAERVATP